MRMLGLSRRYAAEEPNRDDFMVDGSGTSNFLEEDQLWQECQVKKPGRHGDGQHT